MMPENKVNLLNTPGEIDEESKEPMYVLSNDSGIYGAAALSLIYLSVVIFIQDRRFFSSAPKEIQAVIKPRTEELFRGARAMGWVLLFDTGKSTVRSCGDKTLKLTLGNLVSVI